MATLPAQSAFDRSAILPQAHKLLNKTALSQEDSARVESLLSLANTLDGRKTRFAQMRVNQAKRELGLPTESRLTRFPSQADSGKSISRPNPATWGAGPEHPLSGSPLTGPLFRGLVVQAMKQYDQLFDVATWLAIESGAKSNIPSMLPQDLIRMHNRCRNCMSGIAREKQLAICSLKSGKRVSFKSLF
jgi:hypothetical protein